MRIVHQVAVAASREFEIALTRISGPDSEEDFRDSELELELKLRSAEESSPQVVRFEAKLSGKNRRYDVRLDVVFQGERVEKRSEGVPRDMGRVVAHTQTHKGVRPGDPIVFTWDGKADLDFRKGDKPEYRVVVSATSRGRTKASMARLTLFHTDRSPAGFRWEMLPGQTPFVASEPGGVTVELDDVEQGFLSDCFLVAAMAATADLQPQVIMQTVIETADSYIVRFANGVVVEVTKALPINRRGTLAFAQSADKHAGLHEVWPAIIEKAYASLFPPGPHAGLVRDELIDFEQLEENQNARRFFEHLTGQGRFVDVPAARTSNGQFDDAQNSNELETILAQWVKRDSPDKPRVPLILLTRKKIVGFAGRERGFTELLRSDGSSVNVRLNHSYVVAQIDLGARTIDLIDPIDGHDLGSDLHLRGLPIHHLVEEDLAVAGQTKGVEHGQYFRFFAAAEAE